MARLQVGKLCGIFSDGYTYFLAKWLKFTFRFALFYPKSRITQNKSGKNLALPSTSVHGGRRAFLGESNDKGSPLIEHNLTLPNPTYYLQPTAYNLLPTTYHLQPTTYHLQPTIYNLKPTTYNLPPTAYHLQPTTYNLPATSYHLQPTSYHLLTTTYHLQPTKMSIL